MGLIREIAKGLYNKFSSQPVEAGDDISKIVSENKTSLDNMKMLSDKINKSQPDQDKQSITEEWLADQRRKGN